MLYCISLIFVLNFSTATDEAVYCNKYARFSKYWMSVKQLPNQHRRSIPGHLTAFWLLHLLLLAGDVEQNPGPASNNPSLTTNSWENVPHFVLIHIFRHMDFRKRAKLETVNFYFIYILYHMLESNMYNIL